ncbi:MAG: hypothetical protein WCI67_09045 [Chloroflexales bacterium]
MARHPLRILLIALTIAAAIVVVPRISANWGGIIVPPQRITYTVGAGGPELTWWQASNADRVAIIEACGARDDLVASVDGAAGWHTRALPSRPLGSCLQINEFFEAGLLGSYGPIPLVPMRVALPFTDLW